MISLKEFLEIFKGTSFSQDALISFYRAAKKSVILSYAGRQGFLLLLKLDKERLWPILKEIDNPALSIYEGADPELLLAFVQTIKEQKEKNSWLGLREAVLKRARLYEDIFGFSLQEVEFYQEIGRRFEEKLIKNNKRKRLLVGGGMAMAMAGAMGTGTYFFWRKRRRRKK